MTSHFEPRTKQCDRSEPKRRCNQYRLFTLFVFQFVVIIYFGGYAHQVVVQKNAVEKIEQLGGTVYYYYQVGKSGWPNERNSIPPGPEWLRVHFGVHWVADVASVKLQGRSNLPAELRSEDFPPLSE